MNASTSQARILARLLADRAPQPGGFTLSSGSEHEQPAASRVITFHADGSRFSVSVLGRVERLADDPHYAAQIVEHGPARLVAVEVPVGILERAAQYADEVAEQACARSHTDADIAREDAAHALARALYAAARGEYVEWGAV